MNSLFEFEGSLLILLAAGDGRNVTLERLGYGAKFELSVWKGSNFLTRSTPGCILRMSMITQLHPFMTWLVSGDHLLIAFVSMAYIGC